MKEFPVNPKDILKKGGENLIEKSELLAQQKPTIELVTPRQDEGPSGIICPPNCLPGCQPSCPPTIFPGPCPPDYRLPRP